MSEHLIGTIGHLTYNADTVYTMWIAMLAVIIFAFVATRKLSIVPNKLQAVAETIMGFFWGLTDNMIGKEGR